MVGGLVTSVKKERRRCQRRVRGLRGALLFAAVAVFLCFFVAVVCYSCRCGEGKKESLGVSIQVVLIANAVNAITDDDD